MKTLAPAPPLHLRYGRRHGTGTLVIATVFGAAGILRLRLFSSSDLQFAVIRTIVLILLGSLICLYGLKYFHAVRRSFPRITKEPFLYLSVGLAITSSLSQAFVRENLLSALTFVLLVGAFYIFLPVICAAKQWNPVRGLTLLAIIVTSASAVGAVAGGAALDENGRFAGVFDSTATSSSYLMFSIIVLSASRALQPSGRPGNNYNGIFLAAACACAVLTRTRSIILTVVPIIVLFSLLKPKRRHAAVGILFAGLGIGVFAFACLIAVSPESAGSARAFLRIDASSDTVLDDRRSSWLGGVEDIQQHPLIGVGFMARFTQGGTLSLEEVGITKAQYSDRFNAHSSIIGLAQRGGIPFAAALVLFIIFRCCAVPWRLPTSRVYLAAVLSIVVPSILFGGMLTSITNVPDQTVWFFLGLLRLQSYNGRAPHFTRVAFPVVHPLPSPSLGSEDLATRPGCACSPQVPWAKASSIHDTNDLTSKAR